MDKKGIKRVYKELDKAKIELYMKQGVAFDFKMIDGGEIWHTGMGSAGEMTVMTLQALCDLFQGAEGVTFEEYAESVKDNLINYYEKDYSVEGEILKF